MSQLIGGFAGVGIAATLFVVWLMVGPSKR